MPSSRPHGNFTSFFETVKCTVKHEFITMPVTKVVQISAWKCTKSVWRQPARGAYSTPPDLLAGFISMAGTGEGGRGKDEGWTAEGGHRGRREGREGGGKEERKRRNLVPQAFLKVGAYGQSTWYLCQGEDCCYWLVQHTLIHTHSPGGGINCGMPNPPENFIKITLIIF